MLVNLSRVSKKRNSTYSTPGGGQTYNCKLKAGCSIEHPVIELQWDGSSSPVSNNYAIIQDFGGRHYWIDNWTYNDRLWTASMSVDVLRTYKTEIGQATKYILRSASEYNVHALDNKYPAVTPPVSTKYPITLQGWTGQADNPYNNGTFVVGVVGYNNPFASGGIIYCQLTPAQFTTMVNNCFSKNIIQWQQATGQTDFGLALKEFGLNLAKSVNNPFDYINSVRWFPCSFPAAGGGSVHLGNIDTEAACTGIANPLMSTNAHITFAADPAVFDWEKIEPYCYYKLVMPPFGTFMLDSREVGLAGGISIFVWIDAMSGMANMQVTPSNSSKTLVMASAQVGVPIEISGIQANLISSISAGASIAEAAAAATAGPIAIGSLAAAATGIANAVGDGWFDVKQSGCAGGIAPVTDDKAVYVTKYNHVDLNSAEFGYPLCKTKTISSLSGFVLCADGEIEIPGATADELREIEAFLTGGFYYE